MLITVIFIVFSPTLLFTITVMQLPFNKEWWNTPPKWETGWLIIVQRIKPQVGYRKAMLLLSPLSKVYCLVVNNFKKLPIGCKMPGWGFANVSLSSKILTGKKNLSLFNPLWEGFHNQRELSGQQWASSWLISLKTLLGLYHAELRRFESGLNPLLFICMIHLEL